MAFLRASNSKGRRSGFTLIEMLISFGIFAVITAYSAANFRVARQSDDLRSGAELLASSIRRMQTMAVSGGGVLACTPGANGYPANTCTTNANCTGGATCVKSQPLGYGIHLSLATGETKKAVTFADLNGNHVYDAGEAIRTDSLSAGPNVALTVLAPVASNVLDIVLEPPKPTVYFNGVGAAAAVTAQITMQHVTTLKTRNVYVNRITGQVSAD